LRAWVVSSDYAEDLRIDNAILTQHAESYRKIRNTFRFILGNIQDNFEKQDFEKIDLNSLPELERYILGRIFRLDQIIKENLKNYNFHKLYKELFNFCSLELSSFYFDIRKDVLYCEDISSKKRKDCIIVLNIILECLLKWLAPIFVFTTEEIFNLLNKNEKSIHETEFPKIPNEWTNEELEKKWQELYQIKQEVNIAIEEKRTNKEIGSSLEADILINVSEKKFNLLEGLDLEEYFITSKATKIKDAKDELKIIVKKANGKKCPRCWKILENKCLRCEKVISRKN
jgi:isoleucyl-tRNA synthetase